MVAHKFFAHAGDSQYLSDIGGMVELAASIVEYSLLPAIWHILLLLWYGIWSFLKFIILNYYCFVVFGGDER